MPKWTWYIVVAVLAVAVFFMAGTPSASPSTKGFEVMKPKAWNVDWAKFTDPAFHSWPGAGKKSMPPDYGKEHFVTKKCPDGTRSDGPCLMQF